MRNLYKSFCLREIKCAQTLTTLTQHNSKLNEEGRIMKLINCFRKSGGFICLALMVICFGQLADGDPIIHESATMGVPGQTSGWGIDSVWFMGSRFYVGQDVQVTAIGGHMLEWTAGNFFGAIVSLSGPSDLPDGYPFTTGEVVASTVFDPGFPSSDFRTPLSVTLTPGYYALIFGSGRFGSMGGEGALPYADQTNLPGASYILWDGSSWWNSASDRARFVVEGVVNYCQASGSDIYQYIMGVDVGSISNIPTGNSIYADYTSLSTTMVHEISYPVTVTRGNPWSDEYDKCGLWVDWNRDKDFSDVGEQITMSLGADPCTFTGTITPPAGAAEGDTRMRVRIVWNEVLQACGGSNYGEVEDYTINVGPSTITISGYVKTSQGVRIKGVNMSASTGETTVTDALGYYELALSAPFSGTITPGQIDWTFSPLSRTYPGVTTDQVNQDFTGTYLVSYGGGSGTSLMPYLIYNAAQLNAIGANAGDWNKYFRLMNDIDLSGYDGKAGRPGFNRIGYYINNGVDHVPFIGVFDGGNYTISNFTFDSDAGNDNVGIFGYLDSHFAAIKNTKLINVEVSSTSWIGTGALIGTMFYGEVTGCSVQGGTVSGEDCVGGLVGEDWEGTISDCNAEVNVSGERNVGGLLGMTGTGGIISDCHASCVVTGGNECGGLIGKIGASGGSVTRCSSAGSVTVTSQSAGGLVGENAGTIEYCFSTANVMGLSAEEIGGLVGRNLRNISNSYAMGSVSGSYPTGGLVGFNWKTPHTTGSITNCYSTGVSNGAGLIGRNLDGVITGSFWDMLTSGKTSSDGGTPKTTEQMQTKTTFTDAGWDFTTPVWQMCECPDYPRLWFETIDVKYGGGGGTAASPYLIYTSEQMQAIGADSNDWDKHFKLMADIDLSAYTAEQFNMIGFYDYSTASIPFSGVFDGNNHSIGNFTYSYSGTAQQQIGIFSYFDGLGTEIRNVMVTNPDVNSGERGVSAGSLIGLMEGGTVINCKVNGGTVRGSHFYAGGLVGELYDGLVTQCDCNTFAIASDGSAGGVVGFTWHGTVSQCSSTGQTNGQYNVGGITGDNLGQILYCRVSGDVNGYQHVGGIAGENSGIIRESFCDGSVTASNHDAGGIAGRNFDEISNCYSTATITAMSHQPGGLAGLNWDGTITNCYSAGTVTGGLKGGLVAYDINGVVTDCFWDTEASGVGYSAAGTPKTTEQMQTKTTFTDAGWDFTTPVWQMCECPDYPRLWIETIDDKYGGGGGTAANPYRIKTAEQMNAIGSHPSDWDKHFKLMADIDLSSFDGQDGRPVFNIIGYHAFNALVPETWPFRGVFDGNGHTITNFSYSTFRWHDVAIFGYVNSTNADIRDVLMVTPNVDVPSSDYVGALVGRLENGTVRGCSVEGGSFAGDNYVGGLVGDSWGTIEQCYCTCGVSGNDQVGGLVGRNHGSIEKSYATGTVSGSNLVGGLTGRNSNAFDSEGIISDSYAIGSVTGNYAGGLVGQNWGGSITNCYSTGQIAGLDDVGGLIGGTVLGGVCVNCFWDIQTSGQPTSAGGTDKTTEQMQTKKTFTDAGWDFVRETTNGTDYIWRLCEDLVSYPRLAWGFPLGDFLCPDGVNFFDYSFFASQWAEENCGASNDCDGRDLDLLGSVDIRDLRIFADNWLSGL